jgi:ankyrin repeat protein
MKKFTKVDDIRIYQLLLDNGAHINSIDAKSAYNPLTIIDMFENYWYDIDVKNKDEIFAFLKQNGAKSYDRLDYND